jgi:hypothetical protein
VADATDINGVTLMLSSARVGSKGRWYKITAEPFTAKLSSKAQADDPGLRPTKGGRVRFLPPEDDSKASGNAVDDFRCMPIEDLCLSLQAVDRLKTQTGLIGYISDASDKTKQYNMRLLRHYESDMHTQSLHEILQASHSSSPFPSKTDTTELCQRDRLFLAAVLQLHGTWLKSQ